MTAASVEGVSRVGSGIPLRTGRPGFALLLSLLLVMALAVMGMGIMAVGAREVVVADAVHRHARAARLAEAAVLRTVEAWSTRAVVDLAVGEGRFLASAVDDAVVTVERIDRDLFLVRGTAAPDARGATGRAALLVRALHPDGLVDAFPAALAATGAVTVLGGSVVGVDSCGGDGPGVVAPDIFVGGGTVTGRPPTVSGPPPLPPSPDPFGPTLATLLASARHPAPTASPRPVVVAGACAPDARSWGSTDPAHPCHRHLPVVVTGDVTVSGGEGRGVLVVDGDLVVTAGAVLEGVVVVRGRLTVEAGGLIRGAVRADAAVITDGAVLRDGCAVAAALSAPALDRAFRPPSRWWIPPF